MSGVLSYDIGTTGVKTCLYLLENDSIQLADTAYAPYSLYFLPNGGAEQDPEEWWEALCKTTRSIASRSPEKIKKVRGISFCSQMQSLVLVDQEGKALRRTMNFMDQRATQLRKERSGGFPRIAGVQVPLLIKSIYHTGVVAASAKDPLWKYLWVKEYEPDIFEKIHKWLDVKEYVIARMTGQFVMSDDSAFVTLLMNKDTKKPAFSQPLMKILGIESRHLPRIVRSTDCVGELQEMPARELGLFRGIKVFAGGGDASLVALGSGCVSPGNAHIYMGTSGWTSVVTDRRKVDAKNMIASLVGVQPGLYNYFAELETAGKCLEWVRDHLALDEINIYLKKIDVASDPASEYKNLYEYLSSVISTAEAGSGGVLFTPWLHGNRCPFEDAYARGMFFNIGLETGKTELLRAVIEGVCYHMRWFIEVIESALPMDTTVRFVGGGALSSVTASILSDVLNRPVEVVKDPQNVGAFGAALLAATGLGMIENLHDTAKYTSVRSSHLPDPSTYAVHTRNFSVFKKMYKKNKSLFSLLNSPS